MAASSSASGIRAMPSTSRWSSVPLPWASSNPWPRRPKPVTSVQAWTRYFTITSLAALLRVVISR